jgi:hypothetical protein
MSSKHNLDLKPMEGRIYVIGREGHIYIDSRNASKLHAELRITDGKITLRDLDSTNGTFLVKNGRLVSFRSGEVTLDQQVSIGGRACTVQRLLETANTFVPKDEDITEFDFEGLVAAGQNKTGNL